MSIKDWISEATALLEASKVETARLDTIILLEDKLERDRAWILAHPESKLSAKDIKSLNNLLSRRANHEPLAYIRKHCEFYNRTFILNHSTLQPRPESESFIDQLKLLLKAPPFDSLQYPPIRVADVGTGCGALGITASLEAPNCHVDLLDISQEAAEIAKLNVDIFTLNINVFITDLLIGSPQNYQILLCNLPYVPNEFPINAAARHEPAIAIFGGSDGLKFYRRLFKQLDDIHLKPLYILLESFPFQHQKLISIAKRHHYSLTAKDGFVQVYKLSELGNNRSLKV